MKKLVVDIMYLIDKFNTWLVKLHANTKYSHVCLFYLELCRDCGPRCYV